MVNMSVSIKISEENYKRLSSLSGDLRTKMQKPISLNDAISYLYEKKDLSELAGSWKMSDGEADEFMLDLKKGWKKWKSA